MRDIAKKQFDGFSLIEISIVLLIIGIIAGGMLKGRDLVESVQLKSVANDVQNIQTAFASYINSYDAIPGDDPSASSKFKNATDGDGDGIVSQGETEKVFEHLFAAGLIDSAKFKKPKIGGNYDIISENGVVKLQLSNKRNGALSKKQTISLMAKIKEIFGENKDIVETDPPLSSSTSQKYIIKMKIN